MPSKNSSKSFEAFKVELRMLPTVLWNFGELIECDDKKIRREAEQLWLIHGSRLLQELEVLQKLEAAERAGAGAVELAQLTAEKA